MRQAVILAAGFGSRLARSEGDIKPLRNVGGASLIHRNLGLLENAGVEQAIVVVGYQGEVLEQNVLEESGGLSIDLVFTHNEEYDKSNGLSVLAAQPEVDGDFLLLMADHIFDRSIVDDAASLNPGDGAVLCIDYKISKVFDIDDATKVLTDGERVLEIHKQLDDYNAIDTGMFACSPTLFEALSVARAESPEDDCSLSQGVATLQRKGTMMVHDVGDALWQDVDTELALRHAEKLLRNDLMDARIVDHIRAAVNMDERAA